MSNIDRRDFLGGLAAGTTAWAAAGTTRPLNTISATPHGADDKGAASAHRGGASGVQSELLEPAFRPLPLGSIRPRGWLARQLRIQADGLSGHLDEFWPDVGSSQWFGGEAEDGSAPPTGWTE